MKWLKKLRLINWHYFADEVMDFGKQTLITGKNAAGKSTIIDAMQVLFVANQRMIKFNPAAHEDAKRTLLDYLKGKIGSDERGYVRDGDFNTYLLAEFEDQEKRESFVVGMVADVFSSLEHAEEFFILAPMNLDMLELIKPDGRLRSRDEFRGYYQGNSSIKSVFEQNKSQYQKALLSRMGHVHERFFQTFTRALSFKPIQNIRDFVYQNILDRQELQLGLMKENFAVHERYQFELQELQKRKNKLGQIQERFQNVEKYRHLVIEQDYVIRSLRVLKEKETFDQLVLELQGINLKLEQTRSELELAKQKKEEATRQKDELSRKLYENSEEKRKNELDLNIESGKKSLIDLEERFSVWKRSMQKQAEFLANLGIWNGNSIWGFSDNDRKQLQNAADVLSGLSANFSNYEGDIEPEKERLRRMGDQLEEVQERMSETRTRSSDNLRELEQQIRETEGVIHNLEQHKRPYHEGVMKLKTLLEERLGTRSPVWIFCEEMELMDETWRNAIEGYLNTQRFDLLVEPSVFREALSIYEREKRSRRIEGIGLVNTAAEQKYLNTSQDGSLAESIDTSNSVIQAHMEHLLGRVMKAVDDQDLLRYRTAVTASCMGYSNLVARQIPERLYSPPYIGAQAVTRQLELKREELVQLRRQHALLSVDLEQLQAWLDQLKGKQSLLVMLADQLELQRDVANCMAELQRWEEERKTIDLSEADRLREQIGSWEKTEKHWEENRDSLNRKIGSLEEGVKEVETRRFLQINFIKDKEAIVEQWKAAWPERLQFAQGRLEDPIRSTIATETKLINWESSRKGNETKRDEESQQLAQLRAEYNATYTFTTNIDAENNEVYSHLLEQIEGLDIPDYQKKVEAALRVSEEEFKSHFVFKLREAIEMAKREFRELNYALDNFPFSSDKYHFHVVPSEKYRRYYDAVMDPRLMERGTLFDVIDDERADALQELFEQLVQNEAEDMEEFTDYRRYLDYDILVRQGDNQYRFSQVLKEKSGGETQTPFYVAILASFYHLYRSERTLRIVVFDEAFNKMDEQRIQTSLKLIKKMNLQLIAAVPDEKIQHMAPEVTTTLIVTNQDYRCFVDMIDRWEDEETQVIEPRETEADWQQETLF
ncbi:chromosome segregation ATPase-like protein [Paenibacillus sp. FSL R7-277]|uniref:ATP-binding protein n=1 Tax=Paenibacillus sp. FSL R7-277 TaxID=1227352 RepID=UPI0003E1E1EF|nr:SbcC/MukB-like Walker B domain-containing protein [Paenibacillus sp. FSL R7-277]ETT74133.1 chromosome segregation ATPase-like protein [Paenibacillus sp. FSL R7-277]